MYGGYTCVKGRQLVEQMYQPQRLLNSQKRVGGALEAISSEQAVAEIAGKLKSILSEHGPRSIASYNGTYAFQNSAQLAYSRAWHDAIGSPSYYSSITIDQPAKVFCSTRHGFWLAGTHMFSDADVLLTLGNNPLVSQYSPPGGVPSHSPFDKLREAKRRGLKLIVVDPRYTELAHRADLYLQIKPGEDSTLLAGMINIIVSESLHDAEFCSRYTDGLDALVEALKPFDLDYVGHRTGLAEADIVQAARMFAAGPRGVAVTGTGPEMASHPNLTQHLVASLNSLCGRVYREGDTLPNPGVLCPPMPRPAQPLELPLAWKEGARSRIDEELGELTTLGFMGPVREMPTNLLADEILMPGEGQVRALIVVGGNPLMAWPDQMKALKALKALDLLVCIDPYLSATTDFADYMIAPKLTLERDDVTLLADPFYEAPYAQYASAVVETDADLLEEWEFYWGLARHLGLSVRINDTEVAGDPKPSKYELLEAITRGSRVPLSWLRDHPGGHLFPEHRIIAQPMDPECTMRLRFFPEGLDQDIADALEQCDDEQAYPFRLICSRSKYVLNSSGRNLSMLAEKAGTCNPAFFNPDDLKALGVAEDALVRISSEDGALEAVATANPRIRRGVVSMYHCWGPVPDGNEDIDVRLTGANTNLLLNNRRNNQRYTGVTRQSAIPIAVTAA
jgi:anaerobic selenocysteine-containing dehydrogenase